MELGLQKAVEYSFKESALTSCYFHFVKALWTEAAYIEIILYYKKLPLCLF